MGLCLIKFDERLFQFGILFPAGLSWKDFHPIYNQGSTAAKEAVKLGQTAGRYVMPFKIILGILDAFIGTSEDLEDCLFHTHLASLVQDVGSGLGLVPSRF
jgi:hypothetical protein